MHHATYILARSSAKAALQVAGLCLAAALSGCSHEQAATDAEPVSVVVAADWSRAEEQPSGMTVLFYPHAADARAVAVSSAETESTRATLAPGLYDIVVFNQIPTEFTHQCFELLASRATASVALNPIGRQPADAFLFPRTADGAFVCEEPEPLATDTLLNRQLADGGRLQLTPHDARRTLTIGIHVDGILNLRSVRGSLWGLARTYGLGTGQPGPEPTYHQLTTWTKALDAGSHTAGVITTRLHTFGLPQQMSPTEDAPLELRLQVLLADGQTTKEFRYDVSQLLRQDPDGGALHIDILADTPTTPDAPPQLPETEGAETDASGFTAEVLPWTSGDTAVSRLARHRGSYPDSVH